MKLKEKLTLLINPNISITILKDLKRTDFNLRIEISLALIMKMRVSYQEEHKLNNA